MAGASCCGKRRKRAGAAAGDGRDRAEQAADSKLMRWGASDVQFVRPVHTVTLLLGDELIPATILGIQSDRVIRGHRFMGEPELTLDNADQYPQLLQERGKVIADYATRKAKIKADAEAAARSWAVKPT